MKYGHVTHINPSFDFKKLTIKLVTVGCLFGVTGCGVKHKAYEPEKKENQVEVQVDHDTNMDNHKEDVKQNESLAQYISLGESENPLKLLVIQSSNNDIQPLHFGYFRREKIVTDEGKTIYKAYFDDVLTEEEINLEADEHEPGKTRYYYQLASRYLATSIGDNKIQKNKLQEFIDKNEHKWVVDGDYYDTFADYDVYQITASDVAHNVVAGSLYTNEVEKNRTR